MSFGLRKTVKAGPFRLTLSGRGLGASVGAGGARVQRSGGRTRRSVRLGNGFSWRR